MLPLSFLKVLDLTDGNPYVSSMLADYGAEVLKIEPPDTGDSIRRRGAPAGRKEGPYQAFYNRCKKSMTLDLDKPAGQALLKRLACQYDMLVTNQSEVLMAQRGLDYESLHAVNERLIYGSLTPFGDKGPWKNLPDYDLLIMARTGLLDKTGFSEKPTRIGFPLAYYYGSWHLSAGMLAAYWHAQSTGVGQKVSTNTWQCVMSVDDTYAQCLLGMNELPRRLGNGFPTTNPTDTFRCKDGWFALSIGSDAQWWAFSKAAGRNDWIEDPRYSHDPVRSMEHYFGDLDQQLRDYFTTLTIAQADAICREAMVPGGPCNTVKELVDDEQVAARGMLVRVDGMLQLGRAAKFLPQEGEDEGFGTAPALGRDTAAVLRELKLGDEETRRLKADHVI